MKVLLHSTCFLPPCLLFPSSLSHPLSYSLTVKQKKSLALWQLLLFMLGIFPQPSGRGRGHVQWVVGSLPNELSLSFHINCSCLFSLFIKWVSLCVCVCDWQLLLFVYFTIGTHCSLSGDYSISTAQSIKYFSTFRRIRHVHHARWQAPWSYRCRPPAIEVHKLNVRSR